MAAVVYFVLDGQQGADILNQLLVAGGLLPIFGRGFAAGDRAFAVVGAIGGVACRLVDEFDLLAAAKI